MTISLHDYSPFEQWAIEGECFVLSSLSAYVQPVHIILRKVSAVLSMPLTNLTILSSVGCICRRVLPRCFDPRPMPATLMRIHSIPADIISCKSSRWSRCQR